MTKTAKTEQEKTPSDHRVPAPIHSHHSEQHAEHPNTEAVPELSKSESKTYASETVTPDPTEKSSSAPVPVESKHTTEFLEPVASKPSQRVSTTESQFAREATDIIDDLMDGNSTENIPDGSKSDIPPVESTHEIKDRIDEQDAQPTENGNSRVRSDIPLVESTHESKVHVNQQDVQPAPDQTNENSSEVPVDREEIPAEPVQETNAEVEKAMEDHEGVLKGSDQVTPPELQEEVDHRDREDSVSQSVAQATVVDLLEAAENDAELDNQPSITLPTDATPTHVTDISEDQPVKLDAIVKYSQDLLNASSSKEDAEAIVEDFLDVSTSNLPFGSSSNVSLDPNSNT